MKEAILFQNSSLQCWNPVCEFTVNLSVPRERATHCLDFGIEIIQVMEKERF